MDDNINKNGISIRLSIASISELQIHFSFLSKPFFRSTEVNESKSTASRNTHVWPLFIVIHLDEFSGSLSEHNYVCDKKCSDRFHLPRD